MFRLLNLFSRGPLTGAWEGTYEQAGRSYRIAALLRHRGMRITGTMQDIDNMRHLPLREFLEGSGLSVTEQDSELSVIRSYFPESSTGEIELRSRLPEKSLLEGRLDGRTLVFTKRYNGYEDFEYVIGNLLLSDKTCCEDVEYSGKLSANFDIINGSWVIETADKMGQQATGAFELSRK